MTSKRKGLQREVAALLMNKAERIKTGHIYRIRGRCTRTERTISGMLTAVP